MFFMWSGFFSPGFTRYFILKISVNNTMMTAEMVMMKSTLDSGPGPCTEPFRIFGCCPSQTSHAKVCETNANTNNRLTIILVFIIQKLYFYFINESLTAFTSSAVTVLD